MSYSNKSYQLSRGILWHIKTVEGVEYVYVKIGYNTFSSNLEYLIVVVAIRRKNSINDVTHGFDFPVHRTLLYMYVYKILPRFFCTK